MAKKTRLLKKIRIKGNSGMKDKEIENIKYNYYITNKSNLIYFLLF
jgi:hypothetical protein